MSTERRPRSLQKVRLVGILEGISFLLLLGVAVPLKYLYGEAILVRVLGPIHGALFTLLLFLLLSLFNEGQLKAKEMAKVLVAALLPAGPFFIDPWLRRLEKDDVASS
ncbi:MAG: DUF3817 domain-containing protein [Polyangiaceae bacterium]|nr:DUF3817 domain-containing protein [Polyangiaceae bacterium]